MTLGFIVVVAEDHVSHRPLPRSQESHWQPQDESASAKEQTKPSDKSNGHPASIFHSERESKQSPLPSLPSHGPSSESSLRFGSIWRNIARRRPAFLTRQEQKSPFPHHREGGRGGGGGRGHVAATLARRIARFLTPRSFCVFP